MNSYGFTDSEWHETLDILKKYREIEKVVLFGSRAKNTFKSMSDVDIVLYGKSITYQTVSALQSDFEDSQIPYMFDILDYKKITSDELKQHIKVYGKTILGGENGVPRGWIETTLGEVINLIGGGTPKTSVNEYWNGIIPWLSVVDFNNDNRWVYNTEKSITELGLQKSSTKLLKVGDIIISARGTAGAMAQLKREMAFNQSCYGIREIEDVSNSDFLFYLIKYSLKQINRNAYGAIFDTITTKTFDIINIALPPLSEQNAIAKILTAFDDKIELLQEQNETLETIVQTIFKEMFGKYQIGDDLPDGWRVGVVGDFIEIKRGGSPRPIKDYISDNGYRWLKNPDATATTSPYIPTIKEHIKKEGFKKTILKKAGDRVFTNFKTDIPREFEIVIPTSEFYQKFDKLIKPIFKKNFINTVQIQTLKKTRDILLPKLMSGEIRVDDFKESPV